MEVCWGSSVDNRVHLFHFQAFLRIQNLITIQNRDIWTSAVSGVDVAAVSGVDVAAVSGLGVADVSGVGEAAVSGLDVSAQEEEGEGES